MTDVRVCTGDRPAMAPADAQLYGSGIPAEMSIVEIAERLLGLPREAIHVRSEAVSGGLSNLGCFLHTAEGPDGRATSFFEKRTARKNELRFFKDTAAQFLKANEPVLPKLYGVLQHAEYTSIVTEFVPGVGREFLRDEAHASSLAQGAGKVSDIDLEQAPMVTVAITPSLVEAFQHRVLEGRFLERAGESTAAPFFDLVAQAGDLSRTVSNTLPLIPSHNDVYIPNMSMIYGSGGLDRCCLVDWGKFGRNVAGAEFHHFFREAMAGGDWRFLHLLYNQYIAEMARRGLRLDLGQVGLGASYYALQRTISRFLKSATLEQFREILSLFTVLRSGINGASVQHNEGSVKMTTHQDLVAAALQASRLKDWPTAVRCWELVVSSDADDAEAWAHLARAFRQTGAYERADASLRRGEALAADNERVLKQRELLDRKLGRLALKAPGDVYHGKTALEYQARRENSKRWIRENAAVETLLSSLPDGLSVIDIPFGTGRFTPLYLAKSAAITGVDVSADMLSAARGIYGDDLAKAALDVGDATQLQYPDNAFDLVVSVRFLQNIIPYAMVRIALKEMARVSRSWAILEFEIRKEDAVYAAPPRDEDPIRGLMTHHQVSDMLLEAGFRLARAINVYDNEASDYSMLLCEVV